MDSHHSHPSMAEHQESDYGDGRDYTYGSPHLTHAGLRDRVVGDLTQLVENLVTTKGRCNALEVGAGHGTFTQTIAQAGATVVVTEMSSPSARVLESRFADTPTVSVIHDPDGTRSVEFAHRDCDLLVFVSVLHHIPDYLGVVADLVDAIDAGGAFYCTQDPTWYPDRSRLEMAIDRGSYLLWRLAQGNVKRGLATRVRRLRGRYNEDQPSDMVEYHAVRDGVNQVELEGMLRQRFEKVELEIYWSTQSAKLQRLGDRLGWTSSFRITATGRLPSPHALPNCR